MSRFEGLLLPELMALMHPPIAAEPVSFIPQTIGWLVIGLWVVVVTGLLGWHGYRHWQRNRYRREALALLSSEQSSVAVARILKRVALETYPRRTVASLHGDSWAGFLVDTSRGDAEVRSGAHELAQAQYREAELSATAVRAAQRWVQHHD